APPIVSLNVLRAEHKIGSSTRAEDKASLRTCTLVCSLPLRWPSACATNSPYYEPPLCFGPCRSFLVPGRFRAETRYQTHRHGYREAGLLARIFCPRKRAHDVSLRKRWNRSTRNLCAYQGAERSRRPAVGTGCRGLYLCQRAY